MNGPWVTVICLCYNHEQFVREAITSVFDQTYPNIQIIVVDDASTDGSVAQIERVIAGRRDIVFLPLKKNLGNCAAFNRGLTLATGHFIVDFATDDVMMPDRLAKQVEFFHALDETYGVVFTDAQYIDSGSNFLRNHYEHLFKKHLIKSIPHGDVYRDVLTTYFISAPTMLVRKSVFDAIGGYDEQLAYEDFDFWVRSSRIFRYAFLDERLTKVRRSEKSMSARSYIPGDRQLHSTYLVCRKAADLNRTHEEKNALLQRVRYELRQSVFSNNYTEAGLFYRLLSSLNGIRLIDRAVYGMAVLRVPLAPFRKMYHRFRFGGARLL